MIQRALVGWILVAIALHAAPVHAGWSYVETTETRADGETVATKNRIRFEGNATRVDFLEASEPNPMFPPGSYMIARKTGTATTIAIVTPSSRSYVRFDPGEMSAAIGGMQASGMGEHMKMEIEDAKVEKLVEEPGESIQGRATTHLRYRTTYTQVQKMAMGPSFRMKREETEDVWLAKGLDLGIDEDSVPFAGGPSSDMIEALEALEKQKARGFALRRITNEKAKMGGAPSFLMMGAGSDETTTKVEVTDLREESFGADLFEIPKGFSEKSMAMPGMPTMPRLDEEE